MAESYRGLTIRIGGDTTKLSQALKSADRAISGTNTEIRKLSQALKLDPSSLEAARLKMSAFEEQATNTAMRLAGLNSAIKDIGKITEIGDFKLGASVEELAKSTNRAHKEAEIARATYNTVRDSLSSMYQIVTKLSSETTEVASKNLFEKMGSQAELGTAKITELRSAIAGIPEIVKPGEEESEAFIAKVKELKKSWSEANKEMKAAMEVAEKSEDIAEKNDAYKRAEALKTEMAQLQETYTKAMEDFSKLSGRVFNYENEDVKVNDLVKALESIPGKARPSEEAISRFKTEVKRLKEEFRGALGELQKANIINQFKSMVNEAEKMNATVVSLNKALVDMKVPSDTLRQMHEQTESAKLLGDAYSHNLSVAREMAKAYEADPTNVSAMEEAEKAYTRAIQNASEALQKQQAIVDNFAGKRGEIEAFTDTSKSADEQLSEMAIKSSKASEEVSKLEGQEAMLEERLKKLISTAREAGKAISGELTDEQVEKDNATLKAFVELNNELRTVRAELDAARKKSDEFSEGFTTAKHRKELEDAEQKVEQYRAAMNAAQDEFDEFKNTDITPKFDITEVDKFKAKLEAITEGSFESGWINQANKEIEAYNANISDATNRLRVLDEALKKNPDDEKLSAERARLYAIAVDQARQKQKLLNEVMQRLDMAPLDKAAISANKVAGNLVKSKQSAEQAVEGVEEYEKVIKTLEAELEQMDSKKHKTGEDVAEIDARRKQLELLSKSYERVKETADQALKVFAKDINTKSYVDAQTEITKTNNAIEKLGETADETKSKDATPKVDQAAFMQAINMLGQAARRVGSEMVESAREIDSAYRDMRKTVNATEGEFEALKEAAIEFSQAHVTSADTMLEMQALGGQLGILADDLGRFGEISSSLDIATNINAEDIALQLGQVANVLHLDIDGMQGFADALVRLGNNMPAQESAIMNVAQRFGAVATTANFSGAEILAWSAAIASTGQRSEMAATAIGNTVSGIEQAVAQGGNSIKAFATIAGMSAEEFTAAWQDSPTNALKAFIEGLHKMTESKESAVAALEDMGITGVRQQQTLLGLSQTVDNLDNALSMSADAWNGVSDQWGNSTDQLGNTGDAAIEAAKKAEGFSGALDILNNNLQNLAASFGDGLVGPMRIAADILSMVNDVVKAIPAPVKTLAEAIGGISIAVPMAVSVIGTLKSGLDNMWTSLLNSASHVQVFEDAVMKAASSGTNLIGIFQSMPGVITAVVTAIGIISSVWAEYTEHQEEVKKATEGLTGAMDAAQSAYKRTIDGVGETKKSFVELRDEIRGVIKDQAELADKLKEDWDKVGTAEATVDGLVKGIVELTRKSSLSAKEQNRLIAMVDSYNSETGNSIKVTDKASGTLDTSIKKIRDMTAAWKENLESETSFTSFKDAAAAYYTAQQKMEELTARTGSSMQAAAGYTDAYANVTASGTGAVISMSQEQIDLQNSMKEAADAMELFSSQTGEMDNGLAMVENELAANGESLDDWGDLTDDQLRAVVAAYVSAADKSTNAIEIIHDALDKAIGDAKTANDEFGALTAEEMEEASKAAAKARADAQKKAYDAQNRETQHQYDREYRDKQRELDNLYKIEQRGRDDIYKAQQRAYDAEYKVAQKAYDEEYKQAQKALDAEYKQWQKYYDDIYNQQKKELDNQYDIEKKAYDERYNLQKKELDKAYNQRKDQLDDEYNDEKDALDKVYKERKKQYDAQLKLLKDKQKDEVDAFKKATDAKLKEMEREYKARVKALEAEYGIKTDDVDDKIDELNAETEAEKKAIEERNQNDKIAELRQAVEKAKSRRKRADAEKALNDYLQEVEQKRNEESRKAEIERLEQTKDAIKDELEARKEKLKEQYDAEVEAYKASREAELEALQAAQDADYEKRQEQYDRLLEQLKATQEAQLEQLKATQEAELESVKEANDKKLESIKEAYDQELERLKENHQQILDNTKEYNTQQLENIKENQQAQLEALKESQQTALENLKQSQQDELELIKQNQQDELEIIKQGHQDQLTDLKNKQQDQLAAIKEEQAKRVEEIKNGYQKAEDIVKESNENVKQSVSSLRSQLDEDERHMHHAMVKNANETGEDVFNQAEYYDRKIHAEMLKSANQTGKDVNESEQKSSDERKAITKDLCEKLLKAAEEFQMNMLTNMDNGGRQAEQKAQETSTNVEAALNQPGVNATQWGYTILSLFGAGISEGGSQAETNASIISENIGSYLKGAVTEADGQDMMLNMFNGMYQAFNNWGIDTMQGIAGSLRNIFGHSTPKEGPLHGDDKWGVHFMQNIIDGMKSQKNRLYRETKRMAEIMEEGFDPDLSVQAAIEATSALKSIGTPVSMASGSDGTAGVFSPVINISISGVSVRNDSDIDKLANTISQRMAAATARELAGRLG